MCFDPDRQLISPTQWSFVDNVHQAQTAQKAKTDLEFLLSDNQTDILLSHTPPPPFQLFTTGLKVLLNPFLKDLILDWIKFKAFPDIKLSAT